MKRGFHERDFDEPTLFKLRIFRQYAREWISVMLTQRQFTQLNIYDFFAGPGHDPAGNPGSPLIILEELRSYCSQRQAQKAGIPVRMVFNDIDAGHIENLKDEVARARCPQSCCHFEFSALSFAEALPKNLPEMKKGNHANLVLMDQFGVKEVTREVVNTLLSCRSTDVLFFVSSSFIKRFIETPEIQAKFTVEPDRVKDVEYRAIHRYICDYYRSALKVPGSLLAPFSIKKGSNIYGLVFATCHRLGMEKFLKVCWALDPSTGEANYNIDADLAWSGEPLLWSEMNTITKIDLFERSLVEFLRKKRATNVELYGFCLEQGFCASKASDSLRKLQRERKIVVTDAGTGSASRQGSFYLQEKTVRAKFGVH